MSTLEEDKKIDLEEIIKKGRGSEKRNAPEDEIYDSLEDSQGRGPMKYIFTKITSFLIYIPIEGWIIIVSGIHEEAQEEDLQDKFADYGAIKALHANMDKKTGFLKGYALIEYEHYSEAEEAIKQMNNKKIIGKTVHVDWAFKKNRK